MSDACLSEQIGEVNLVSARWKARQQSGLPCLDLTDSNPTRNGFLFPPEILIEHAKKFFGARRYEPDAKGLLEARESVCAYYKRRVPNFSVSPEQVFLTASTSEAYSLLFAMLCAETHSVFAPNIGYPLIEYLAAHHGVNVRYYELLRQRSGWSVESDLLGQPPPNGQSAADAAIIVSPHNPTGHVMGTRSEFIAGLGVPLICDEVFCEMPIALSSVPPVASFYEDLPVFTLNGISKMFALPDMKLGWMVLNERAYREYGERLEFINDLFLSGNMFSQTILPALFEKGSRFASEMALTLRKRVIMAHSILSRSSRIECALPDGGYYLFPRFIGGVGDEEFCLSLIEKGVLVHPGYFYGDDSSKSFMVSALVEEDKLVKGCETILEALGESEN